MTTPLSATELEDRLDELLAAVMSSRRTAAAPARTLARCVRAQQDFVQGLAGRTLKIAAHEQTYTDTQTIHLPARSAGFDRREDNFRLYKAMAAHQWAQNHFGTFRVDLVGALSAFPDPERATRLFHWLETVRLDACIARELPGLHRDLQALRASAGDEALTPRPATARLKEPGATVGDTLAVLRAGYPGALPAPCCYQGVLRARRVAEVMQARQAREKQAFQRALAQWAGELHGASEEGRAPRDVHGRHEWFHQGLDQRRRTGVAGIAV